MRLIGSQREAQSSGEKELVSASTARMCKLGMGLTHLKQKSPNRSSSPSSCTSCTAAAAMSTFHAAVLQGAIAPLRLLLLLLACASCTDPLDPLGPSLKVTVLVERRGASEVVAAIVVRSRRKRLRSQRRESL